MKKRHRNKCTVKIHEPGTIYKSGKEHLKYEQKCKIQKIQKCTRAEIQ